MGDVTDFAQIPYPTLVDGPNVSAWLMEMAELLDTRVVLPATSVGDRDSKYGALGPGAIVATTQAPFYVWLRTRISESVLGWATLYEDTGWIDIPSDAWKTDWSDLEVSGVKASGYHRLNGRVEVYLRAVYGGTDVIGPTGTTPAVAGNQWGNIVDIPVVELPSGARPLKGQVPGMFLASCPGSINITVAGIASITHLWPGGTLATGTVLTYNSNWRR